MKEILPGTIPSNSRGRAQQILRLQQKVNELQAKQNDLKNKDEHNSIGT